jgi:hypothetical protein
MKTGWVRIACVLIFLLAFGRISLRNLHQIITESAPDFTQVRVSAQALLASKDPYHNPNLDYPNGYPPLSEIFYLPFAPLPYHEGLGIFTYISFAAIVGSVFLCLKIVNKTVSWQVFILFLGITFLSFPTRFSLGLGQVNFIVLFLMLSAFFLETNSKKSIQAGLLYGIAIALKPVFGFFLLFFALQKSWKLIITTLITVTSLITVTLILWPIQFWFSWYKSITDQLAGFTSNLLYIYVDQGVFSFLSRMISNFQLKFYFHWTITAISISLAVYRVIKNKNINLGLSLFITTLLLFDIISWQHHYVWTIFPFTVLLVATIKNKNLWTLYFLLVALFLISWNYKQPSLHPVIFRSNQFYGGVILWIMTLYYMNVDQSKTTKVKKGSIRYKIFELLDFITVSRKPRELARG